MKKILIAFLALVTALSCFAFIGCENKKEDVQANADKQATLDMYIFDKDGQTISEDFVLPGKIGKYDATWTSNNSIIALEELAGDEENGIARQYVAKVGLPEERTEINLTVALSEEVTKSFTVYVNSLSVYDFSGSYNFIQNNGTVFTSFALDTTCEFKGYTATIAWSVDEEYADYLEISEDGKECIVYPSSLNPQVRINATFTYKGESTTKGYRMTVSEQKEPLQEVDYWYTNEGVGIVMSGYVVSIATVYSESYGNVSLYMVNDEFTAGYYLYRVKADSQNAALLAPGVHVTVTGTTNTNYNGLIETNAGGTLVVDADVPAINVNEKVYAIDNDIIGDLQSAHYNQSRLVSLTNWKVKEIKATPDLASGTQTLFVLTKAGVDVPVVISKYQEGAYAYSADNATCAALIALQGEVKVGDIVSVTGILGNYKGHQIAPLSAEAVVVGGTADAEGTVYAGQKAAKAVAAIDKLIADNGLASIVAIAKNIQLPATVEGCEVAFRVIGEPRTISIANGALVINPGKMERACLTAAITVDGFTTNIFRYIEAADLDDAGKVELEEEELTFVTDEAINADTVLTVPVVGNLFNNVTISWASNNECAVVDGSTITITVPEEIIEVTFTATITLNDAVLTKEFVVEVGKPANISLVDFVALASGLEDKGPTTTKKYLVSGIVTEIASTKYGNLYITDAAGNTLYVYGCYDADGTNRYDAMGEAAPQVGDYVVLFGVASNYNGPQMKNAWVQTCVSPISIEEATAIALELTNKGPTSTEKYLVTGTVTEIASTQYGNLYITDDAGNKLYIYGVYSEDGANRYDAMGEAAPQVGDVITVYGVASNYNGAQLKNVCVVARTVGSHEHDFTGEWKSNATKHWKECACNEVSEEADHSLENNVCSVCGYEVVVVTYVQPVAGNKYYLSMLQGKAGKTVYLAGGMAQTYYLATTEDKTAAVKVFVENAEGGLYLGYYDADGAKNYLNVTVSADGAHVNSVIASAAETVYTYSAELGTLVADVNGTPYIIGTRNDKTYTTIGPVKQSTDPFYVLFELVEGGVTPPVECEHVWVDATCTAPKTCSKCGETEGSALDHIASEEISKDALNHWNVCTVCGAEFDKAAHEYVEGVCSCGQAEPVKPELPEGNEAIAQYTGTSTVNMVEGSNNAALIGLDEALFNVTTNACGSYKNKIGLNKVGTIRLYSDSATRNGNELTITISEGKILAIVVTLATDDNTDNKAVFEYAVLANGAEVIGFNGEFVFANGVSAVIVKNNQASGQVRIRSIKIIYAPACEHTGGTATCQALAICANCGESYGELGDHAWGESLSHDVVNHWVECSVCGEKKDESAHDFANGDCVCGELKPVCNHVWSDATCTEGSVCTICGEEGEAALGHDWADATCTAPKTCSVCNVTEGEALGHDWADATCTAPKTCQNGCGLTEGEALGHKDESADYKCDVCSTLMAPEADSYLTVEQAIALAKAAGSSYTTAKYFVTGIVTNVYNTTYGNMYIKDENGKQLCIYGLYTWDKETRYDKMTYKPVEGDELSIYGILGTYNSNAQMKDAWMDDVVAHEHNWSDATCTAPKTCSICKATEGSALGHTGGEATCTEKAVCTRCENAYGSLLDHNFVDGTCSACGEVEPTGGEVKPVEVKMTITANTGSLANKVITWTSGDVTFANAQASSSNAIRTSDSDHFRAYAKSDITISVASGTISKVVLTCTGSSYVSPLQTSLSSVAGATVSVSGNNVIIEFATPVASFTATMTAQSRIKAVVVTYTPAN